MKSAGFAMGSSRRTFLFCWFLLSNLQPTRANKPVFQTQLQAAIFLRPRRANAIMFEEIFQGNLERECIEERCSREEAREFFENDAQTEAFWNKYIDGDQCESNPCQNGGTCTDRIGSYNCACADIYVGHSCERDSSQCPVDGPYACEHFCHVNRRHGSYSCRCAQGYRLHPDERRCIPHVKHPCGKISLLTSTPMQSDNEICPQGHCPWQVILVDKNGESVCGGVILGPREVLTTATCMSSNANITHIHIGKNHSPGSKIIRMPLEADPTTHSRYRPGQPEYDLCFLRLRSRLPLGDSAVPLCLPEKDFSENILMQDGEEGVISPGPVRHSYVSLDDCRVHLNLSFTLNNKMFCMKERNLETKHKGKGKTPSILQSSPITQKKGIRPRTQQTVWGTEEDLFEYSEYIVPLSDVESTVTPTAQNKIYLTAAAVIRNSTQEKTPKPTAESGPKKVEKPTDIAPLSEDVKSTVTPNTHNKTYLTADAVIRNSMQEKTTKPTSEKPTNVEKSAPTISRRGDCRFLSGTPVASVKGETVFVTGLMLSHDCGQGLVFTKLSRFLPWIESMLEST
ncbi:hypothetical protein AALO_G00286090 [Alosa alosa]|uniref:Uncharacterized protein n=1 Tax=Alosa alosa TaxID=278164 RepID=A0AAV6FIU3_9TELE|nr:protein Z, vitamin K-dependent plasma glycoprotein b [Alosa alosa]KAG5261591.1 hypothetical protein AALO_G00286090 [Alosa alosa]